MPEFLIGVWLRPVERTVRVREVESSNLSTPTKPATRCMDWPISQPCGGRSQNPTNPTIHIWRPPGIKKRRFVTTDDTGAPMKYHFVIDTKDEIIYELDTDREPPRVG